MLRAGLDKVLTVVDVVAGVVDLDLRDKGVLLLIHGI